MTANLIIWKWADEFQNPSARRKEKLTHGSVIRAFMTEGDESKFGHFDVDSFEAAAKSALVKNGYEEEDVVIEKCERCLVFSVALQNRVDLFPLIGKLAMAHSLNGTEGRGPE